VVVEFLLRHRAVAVGVDGAEQRIGVDLDLGERDDVLALT
jgi:hypothetical protein